jgi:hypothetical protein
MPASRGTWAWGLGLGLGPVAFAQPLSSIDYFGSLISCTFPISGRLNRILIDHGLPDKHHLILYIIPHSSALVELLSTLPRAVTANSAISAILPANESIIHACDRCLSTMSFNFILLLANNIYKRLLSTFVILPYLE